MPEETLSPLAAGSRVKAPPPGRRGRPRPGSGARPPGAVDGADGLDAFDPAPDGFRPILDGLVEPVFVKDREHRFVFVNRAFCALLGLPREALLGTTGAARLPEGEMAAFFRTDDEVIATGGTLVLEQTVTDARGVVHQVVTKKSRLGGPSGQPLIVGILREVTAERQADRELQETLQRLRESEARQRALLDGITDLAWLKDAAGRYLAVNEPFCEACGRPASEVIGKDARAIWPAVQASKYLERDARVLATGKPERAEGPLLRSDGSTAWVETIEVPVYGEQGEVVGTAGVARDCSVRRREEEEIRQAVLSQEAANRELDAFASSVSHDLKAPLRRIGSFSEALLEDHGDGLGETGRDFVERIRRSAAQMEGLIGHLLELSRSTQGPLRLDQFDLGWSAAKVVRHLREAEPQRQVEVDIAPGLRVEGDPELMHLVVENLLGNAWKFTRPVARPYVQLGRVDAGPPGMGGLTEQTFFVRDNGVGFDPTQARRLFVPFQRLHRQEEFPGTGIGLATVRRIIHRHGGRIWAEAEIGAGATFYFTLPKGASG